jgi:ferritin-like metal-binding protein YciE
MAQVRELLIDEMKDLLYAENQILSALPKMASAASGKDQITADLALIDAAQEVEHYEIAGYGNARTLALQIEEREVARLFEHTLGEEESADHMLTEISKPLLHQARTEELSGTAGSRGTASSGSVRPAS